MAGNLYSTPLRLPQLRVVLLLPGAERRPFFSPCLVKYLFSLLQYQGMRTESTVRFLHIGLVFMMLCSFVPVSGCIDELFGSDPGYGNEYDPYDPYPSSSADPGYSGVSTIYVRSYPIPSYIYVDGVMVDSTWDEYEFVAVTVSPGYHTLEVTKPGYEAYSESLYLGAYEEITRDVYLRELYAPPPTSTYPVYTPDPTWEPYEPVPTYVMPAATRPIY
jgi:hypothetical protein